LAALFSAAPAVPALYKYIAPKCVLDTKRREVVVNIAVSGLFLATLPMLTFSYVSKTFVCEYFVLLHPKFSTVIKTFVYEYFVIHHNPIERLVTGRMGYI
jgi:hypothetical protein